MHRSDEAVRFGIDDHLSSLGDHRRYPARVIMRFSIFTLLGITAAASVSAALSRLEFETGCVGLVAIVAVSMFIVPKLAWRYCVYFGIGGIAIGILLMMIYMYIKLGRISGSSYDETNPLIDVVYAWRPWIVFCGSLVGGTTGLLLFQNRKQIDSITKPTNNQSDSKL